MIGEIRGKPTAPAAVPKTWRGPLPDLSAQRRLDTLDGYTMVPQSLLHAGMPDLGVLVWVVLRARFDNQSGAMNYHRLAAELGLDGLTDSAIEQRFGAAIRPLLGTWIIRTPAPHGSFRYQAALPVPAKRYAMVRRSDIALLRHKKPHLHPVTVADVVDFARWQLECGARGWTADSLRAIADRWGIRATTLKNRRDRLCKIGWLQVVPRPGGRHSDLTWLRELYDMHWHLPVEPGGDSDSVTVRESASETEPSGAHHTASAEPATTTVQNRRGTAAVSDPNVSIPTGARKPTSPGAKSIPSGAQRPSRQGRSVQSSRGPIKDLTGSLTVDLSDLGGASAPPLSLVTRESPDAPPTASSDKDVNGSKDPAVKLADSHSVASRLISAHQPLVRAKPWFRGAMLRHLSAALQRGLYPEHAERALQRVIDEGAFDAECRLLNEALGQAWADQQAGMCHLCGRDRTDHADACPARAAADGLGDFVESVQAAGDFHLPLLGAEDPLAEFLKIGDDAPTSEDDPAETVRWMTGQLAQEIAHAPNRGTELEAFWLKWRRIIGSDEREALLNEAVGVVRSALAKGAPCAIEAPAEHVTNLEPVRYIEGAG